MYKRDNLRVVTNSGNKGGKLYFYFNDDNSVVSSDGFFDDVRLTTGDVITVYDGTKLIDYKVTSSVSNKKTVDIIRDVYDMDGFVRKYTTMPATAEEGDVALYSGTTTESYTSGYIYKYGNVVETPHTPESLTVTQTSGENLGTITTDAAVFRNAIGADRDWTYQFSCIGKPRIVSLWKMSGGMQSESLTRDSTFDIAQLRQYGWIDDGNNWYFTNTEFPDETTIFYEGSSEEIGTPTSTNSGWVYMATTSRQTVGMGIWTIGVNEEPVELSDYGIYCSSAGLIGDKLSAVYVKEVAQVSSNRWTRIDVQPLDLTQVSGYDATKSQTLTNTNGTISWVDNS